MNLLKRGFFFYIFANIHVAFACYSLTRITYLQFNFQNEFLPLFVLFSTILSYNLIRFVQLDSIQTITSKWIAVNKRGLIVLNSIAFLGMLFCAVKLKLQGFYALLPFFVATLLYVFPASNKFKGLRQIPGLKLFLISFSWAGVTLYFPIIEGQVSGISNLGLHFVQRFMFVLAITIPFDIRDSQFDQRTLATLPQVFGITKAKWIACMALVLFLVLDMLLIDLHSVDFRIHVMICLITAVFIGFSSPFKKWYYTMFWIEAIPILWYVTLLIIDKSIF